MAPQKAKRDASRGGPRGPTWWAETLADGVDASERLERREATAAQGLAMWPARALTVFVLERVMGSWGCLGKRREEAASAQRAPCMRSRRTATSALAAGFGHVDEGAESAPQPPTWRAKCRRTFCPREQGCLMSPKVSNAGG